MQASITDFFRKLGADLTNPRWSWGAVRKTDGAVFLRVWQDRKRKHDGKWYMMATHNQKYFGSSSNGWLERLSQVEIIKKGAPCYLIMCEAVDVQAESRVIKSYDDKDVFLGGQIITADGDEWIELAARLPISNVLPQHQ